MMNELKTALEELEKESAAAAEKFSRVQETYLTSVTSREIASGDKKISNYFNIAQCEYIKAFNNISDKFVKTYIRFALKKINAESYYYKFIDILPVVSYGYKNDLNRILYSTTTTSSICIDILNINHKSFTVEINMADLTMNLKWYDYIKDEYVSLIATKEDIAELLKQITKRN